MTATLNSSPNTPTIIQNSDTKLQNKYTSRKERILRIRELAEKIGFFNINKSELAAEMGVSRTMIYKDLEKIFREGIDKNTVAKAIVNIDNIHKQLLRGLQVEFIKAKNPTEKAAIANALMNLQEKITTFLEKYGFKEIEAQHIDTDITISWGKKEEKKVIDVNKDEH